MLKTLKGKITTVYLCLVLIIAIVGISSVINLYQLNMSIDGLLSANYRSIKVINSMLDACQKQDRAVLTYISINNQKGIDDFASSENDFRSNLDTEKNNITEKGEFELVDKVYKQYNAYIRLFFNLQEIKHTQGENSALIYYHKSLEPSFHVLTKDLKDMLNLNETAMFTGKQKATENSKNSMYIIVFVTLIAIIGGFFTSLYFTNKFLRPIYKLINTLKLVKEGDLNQQAEIISSDEIGQLASEFNNMTSRLLQFEKSAIGSLMTEKNRFTSIVKNISDPLIVMDRNYKFVIINKACENFFNIQEENARNKHFLEVIKDGELFDHISLEIKNNEEKKERIILFDSKEEEHYLNVVVTPVKDIENQLTGYIVLFQDVTSLKELEKTRTDFIATISHEFKTPLTSIVMGIDLLQNKGLGELNDDQASITAALKEDCERLTTLVDDIMELSKLESGQSVFNIKPRSITGIIENTYRQFKPIAESKNIQLTMEFKDGLPKVLADFDKISWVLNNLVSNAIKYTNAGDFIQIGTSVKGDHILVSVRDTGLGIPEEYNESIFEKFFQVKGNDFEIRGTGLGLSVAKEIINSHGGDIWCESKLDMGSTFFFTLKLDKTKESYG